ncbi:hypothetical protein PVK06_023011 [Gossypium arboreum]|uniref:Uncharacterized protein n=1 Tax=Gossypium arboreum TaxID=29729 RepID=A0ABR0PA88_GOSAR|nr:hypothetical protein PVK06_023011 [Gossypium arboreum]
MGEENKTRNLPHVLIFPFPVQGHITLMSHFAKRLVSKGIKITLVAIVFISKSFFPNPCSTTSIDLETIFDGFDEGGSNQALSTKVYIQMLCFVGSNSTRRYWRSSCSCLRWVLTMGVGSYKAIWDTVGCVFHPILCYQQCVLPCKGILQLPLLPEVNVSLPRLPLLQVSELLSFISGYKP